MDPGSDGQADEDQLLAWHLTSRRGGHQHSFATLQDGGRPAPNHMQLWPRGRRSPGARLDSWTPGLWMVRRLAGVALLHSSTFQGTCQPQQLCHLSSMKLQGQGRCLGRRTPDGGTKLHLVKKMIQGPGLSNSGPHLSGPASAGSTWAAGHLERGTQITFSQKNDTRPRSLKLRPHLSG